MIEIILKEGVLNDDTLFLAKDGYSFKYGYVAIIEQWHFLNTQSNYNTRKCFKKISSLLKFIDKNYPNANLSDLEY